MSWSGNARFRRLVSADDIESLRAIQDIVVGGNDQAAKERDEQVQIAKQCAFDIIRSSAFDNVNGTISVNISGHANLRHEPVSGYSNESITINVYQVD